MENEDITHDLIKLIQGYKSHIPRSLTEEELAKDTKDYNTDNYRKMDSDIWITNIALINLLMDLRYIAEFPGITGLDSLIEYEEISFTERHLIYKLYAGTSVDGFLNTLIKEVAEFDRMVASAIETD